jgi:hypothetical protein
VTASRVFLGAAIVVVALTVAAALTILGTPDRSRALALDEKRLDDLHDIAQELRDDYADGRRSLPLTLASPRYDPVSRAPYGYRRLGGERYLLCADFALANPATGSRDGDLNPFWRHSAGRTCYRLDARIATRPLDRSLP